MPRAVYLALSKDLLKLRVGATMEAAWRGASSPGQFQNTDAGATKALLLPRKYRATSGGGEKKLTAQK